MHMLLLVPLMALVGAGFYVTFVGIPESVRGLYRMHIYAPPTAFFIVAASAVLIVAPFQELTPANHYQYRHQRRAFYHLRLDRADLHDPQRQSVDDAVNRPMPMH